MGSGRIASLDRLIEELKKLPGIGARSAERLAFHILRSSSNQANALADAITNLKQSIRHCSRCFNLTDHELCGICSDASRDQSQIWVVEQPKDILALEATGLVRGVYHVLMGHIAPLDGVEPGDLTIEALVQRVKDERVEELILATNPTMEGDGTALYLESILEPLKVRTTRLARGLAVGSQLEYATTAMLEAAIRGRS
ncbi:MAG: recombination protein RecR [Planctomycetes bacterium]|nr:recombination protein RecR [Planctomycetota bacterium]